MKSKAFFVTAAALAILSASCVSTASAAPKAPPAWVLETPASDGTYNYFVGTSSDSAGDLAKATDAATSNVISEVVRMMGVKIKSEFVGGVQATLDSYTTSMKQTVTQDSKARFVGFSIQEKYVAPNKDKKSKSVTIYVLARYESKELQKERARLQALIDEEANAVLVPESAGNEALAAGRVVDAAASFLQAASGAAGGEIENKDIKIERNLNNARNALAKLRIVKVSGPASAAVGQEPESFVAKVVNGEDDAAPGVPGVKVNAEYKKKSASGRQVGRSEVLTSDSSGLVSLKVPAFDSVFTSKITFSIDLNSAVALMDGLPEKYEAVKEAFTKELALKYLELPFVIGSSAAALPVSIALVDIDESQKVTGSVAQSIAVELFVKGKVKASAANGYKDLIMSADEAGILAKAKAAGIKRLVWGSVAVQSIGKEDGAYTASASLGATLIDVESGMALSTVTRLFTSIASSETDLRQTVFRDGAKLIAKDMLSKM